ncbi:DUF3108 domain-containing protein [Massilia phosphatilytica]
MRTAYAKNHGRRRQLALGVLTILLHVLVFVWFAGQVGRVPDRSARMARAPLTAELVEAPQPRPLPPMPPPQPALDPPPVPEVVPEPVIPVPPPPGPDDAAPAQGAPDGTAAGATPALTPQSDGIAAADAAARQTGQDGAVGGAGTVQSRQAAPQGAAAQAQADAAPKPPAAPEARRYKVDMPPSADITLDVARTDANGTKWSGDALLSWRVTPSGYRVQVEAGIRIMFAHAEPAHPHERGYGGQRRIRPHPDDGEAARARHDGDAFQSSGRHADVFGIGREIPAGAGRAGQGQRAAADLAAIARGDPKQLSGNIDILVGEDRDASVFTFTVAGQEQIDTPLGRIATWHLVRPPKPGSYNSRLELWLAPGYGWYPVQIRNVEASGAVTTQTVNNIVIKQAGS